MFMRTRIPGPYKARKGGGGERTVAPARKTKQSVYAIINHDNLKQKASAWFVSLKVLEATFCVGVKTKCPTRNPVYIRKSPVKLCRVCPRRLGTTLQ